MPINKKITPPIGKVPAKKTANPNPQKDYKAHYTYATGQAKKMGMIDPVDIRSYANQYAISKGGKKIK